MKLIVLFLSVFAATLTFASQPPPVVETWGGQGIELTVLASNKAIFSFDCGVGSVEQGRWVPGQSRYKAVGTMTQHTGVRPPPGYTPPVRKATYAANVDVQNGKMTLTVKVSGNKRATVYNLTKGAEPTLHRCM